MVESVEFSDRLPLDVQNMRPGHDWADVQEALTILDTNDSGSVESFLNTWGQQKVTFIHLACYAGRIELLNRARAFGLDLYVTDKIGKCGLHYAASAGHADVVGWFVERSIDRSQLSFQDTFGRTALHLAVRQKHVDVVKLLVDANVDVNIRDKGKLTPLHSAWNGVDCDDPKDMQRYENIVDLLLCATGFRKFIDEPLGVSVSNGSIGRVVNTTVLNCAVRLNSPHSTRRLLELGLIIPRPYQTQEMTTALHIAAEHGFHQTLRVLLKCRHLMAWMINMRDEMGKTPLYVAVSRGHLKCAHILAHNGASLLCEAKNGLTVVAAVFRYIERPMNFLTELLDAGVYATEKNGNMLTLDFKVLTPEAKRQMAVVSTLISTSPSMKQMSILQHPLVEAFLGLKWRRLSYSFVILVAFQAIFVACLLIYGNVILKEKSNHPIPRRMMFVCAIVMLLHNIVQLVMIPMYYVRQFDTWLSFTYATTCATVAIAGEFGFDHPQRNGLPPFWILQSVSVAIILACIQMMLLIGRFPPWGYYALMFSTVLKNVFKVFLAVVWIIVGFSLSFSIIFHNDDQFDDPWKAFVKTVVMMMGEYEYSDLFRQIDDYDPAVNVTASSHAEHGIRLPITSRIIFLAFVMLASIVLMNLMIGLAVIDIQGLLNEGLILRLMKQAEFVTHLEQVTSHWIFRSRFFPGTLRKMLDDRNTIPTQIQLSSARHGTHPPGISDKLLEKLFDLSSRNESLRKKTRVTSTRENHGRGLAETISRLEEGLKKLKQEMMELQEVEFSGRDIERTEDKTGCR